MSDNGQRRADTLVVLDFETTGLSIDNDDRAIEIGAVRLVNGQITDRFQSLMNPGRRVSGFIESYTGISNSMLAQAPMAEQVMSTFAEFLGDDNLVAHNASFDQRFLEAEFNRVRHRQTGQFACSMLCARRVYPEAPNHKLGTLVRWKQLPTDGTYHRALADAEMTAHLWVRLLDDLAQRLDTKSQQLPLSLLRQLGKTQKAQLPKLFQRAAAELAGTG
ncbi:3'-5' exonuclease [Motiliproteus coralliicola]|uniref:DNA-directed DNA polymerase n=1 Tax=Motiliproteus coralliicola TaxID=2283196 RepID=A0A369WR90_9GAMM|nr:3'-5' exonuclease [Motiliproteus coralliicola]RDE24051.1 3'-5' exonuclease [Motiliproteus coralliicola]